MDIQRLILLSLTNPMIIMLFWFAWPSISLCHTSLMPWLMLVVILHTVSAQYSCLVHSLTTCADTDCIPLDAQFVGTLLPCPSDEMKCCWPNKKVNNYTYSSVYLMQLKVQLKVLIYNRCKLGTSTWDCRLGPFYTISNAACMARCKHFD